jgi:phage terminase large subunit-like protein
MSLYPTGHLSKKQLEIKQACEESFITFIRVVAPWLNLGHIHEDVANWLQQGHEQGIRRLLALLPRGHLKSKIIALYASWRIIRNPAITILYGSASGSLAERQLYDICNVLDGPDVRLYWRGLINPKLSERDLWRNTAINVDHPARRKRGIRDNTIRACSVGATITGDHYDLALLDDIIAPNSDADPWTEAGRLAVAKWYSQLASVLNPGGEIVGVGTRYIGSDIYNTMMETERRIYDDVGNLIRTEKVYSVMQAVVETNGQFLWPRMKGKDGDWYGFSTEILEEIRETYRKAGQMEQFYAQYYQDPTDKENPKIKANFLYYEPSEQLSYTDGHWAIKTKLESGIVLIRALNVFASMDLAFTTTKDSDYTAIIVIGVDSENYRYVLDIVRFKTKDPYEMCSQLFNLYGKWGFIKARIEVTAAQVLIIPIIQKQMVVRNQRFMLDEYKPTAGQGKKEDRIMASLSPLYQLQQIYHFRGGLCQELERQIVTAKPDHDDIADVMASVQEIAYPPGRSKRERPVELVYNSRFGGVSDLNYN